MTATTVGNLIGHISASTAITFAKGAVEGTSRVIALVRRVSTTIFFVEETPFHPINNRWPDQPADRGTITFPSLGKTPLSVANCQVWAIHKTTQEVRTEHEIPRQEKENWWQVVGHEVELPEISSEQLLNAPVEMRVDAAYRDALSLHHSASHLAACAFNSATRKYWAKPTDRLDSFGFANTDQLAIDRSSIFPDRSEEIYRFGKSIRKSGLETQRLLQDKDALELEINQLLQEWIATRANTSMESSGPCISDARKWICPLPIGRAEIPCGGTHVPHLGAFARIQYTLAIPEGEEGRLVAIIKAEKA